MHGFFALVFLAVLLLPAAAEARKRVFDDEGDEPPAKKRAAVMEGDEEGTPRFTRASRVRASGEDGGEKANHLGVRGNLGWGFGLNQVNFYDKSGLNANSNGTFGNPGSGLTGALELLGGSSNGLEGGLLVQPYVVEDYKVSHTNPTTGTSYNITQKFNSTALILNGYATRELGRFRAIGGLGVGYSFGGEDVRVSESTTTAGVFSRTTTTTPIGGAVTWRGTLAGEVMLTRLLNIYLGASLLSASFSPSGDSSIKMESGGSTATATGTLTDDSKATTLIAVSKVDLVLGLTLRFL
jgi:hypothetical protein